MSMMLTARVERYLFDRTFEPAVAKAVAESAPSETFTASEVERARAEGFARGRAEAEREREQLLAAEHRRQQTLDDIAANLIALQTKDAALADQAGRDATLIAVALARALLPHRYRSDACAEIEALVGEVLARLPDEPAVVVRATPSLLAELAPRLDAAADGGASSRLRLAGDANLAEGDCRIEWRGGGIVRDQQLLWQEIDRLMDETIGDSALTRKLTGPSQMTGNDDA